MNKLSYDLFEILTLPFDYGLFHLIFSQSLVFWLFYLLCCFYIQPNLMVVYVVTLYININVMHVLLFKILLTTNDFKFVLLTMIPMTWFGYFVHITNTGYHVIICKYSVFCFFTNEQINHCHLSNMVTFSSGSTHSFIKQYFFLHLFWLYCELPLENRIGAIQKKNE